MGERVMVQQPSTLKNEKDDSRIETKSWRFLFGDYKPFGDTSHQGRKSAQKIRPKISRIPSRQRYTNRKEGMMGNQENYYKAPTQEIFDEIKEQATKIWQTYDNQFGYVDEKVNRIKNIQNFADNAMHIVAMFDVNNQRRLLSLVDQETKDFILGNLTDEMVSYLA